jgi:predicted Zn-dependent peptidase
MRAFTFEDRMRRMSILLAAALSWTARSQAINVPSGYAEETLDNGLRVVLIQHRANPMVASAVIVGAGVVHESPGASGASHFLEHLLFNGTTGRSQKELYEAVDRLGAYNNATTREDHTLFTLLVAKDFAEQGLAIQADMVFRSTIPETSFDKERKIVLEELARDRTDPDYDRREAFRAFAFAGTPIARPVLGTEASLKGIARADVVAYYKARYVPSNMTLVVMGDFEISAMRASVRRTFGTAPRATLRDPARGTWPPRPKDNVAMAPVESGPARLTAAFPWTADPWDKATAAAQLLLAAASRGKDAPLAQMLAARGIAADGVSLDVDLRARPWSTVTFDAELAGATDPRPALDVLTEAVRATGPDGWARSRLDRVLATERAEAAMARDQIHYYAMMRSATIPGCPEGYLAREAARFDALGPADWDAASAQLVAGLKALRATFTAPGADAVPIAWSPPAPPPVAERTPLLAGALPNGVRYVVRTSDDSDVFAMHVAFAARAAGEPQGQEGITDLLHRMMLRGTSAFDQAALEDVLAQLGAKVKAVDDPTVPFDDYYTTPEFSWLRLEAPGDRWHEAMRVASGMIVSPALDATSLESARKQMQELLGRSEGSPRGVAMTRLDALLAPGRPATRPVLGTRDSLGSVTLERLADYRASAVVGSRLIVTVVSRIPAEQVVRAIQQSFGGLPAGEPATLEAPGPAPTAGTSDEKLGKPQAYIAMARTLDVDPKDRPALTVAVAMLSDRLAFDLRETKGLAYSVGASLRYWDGRFRCDVTMGTRPDNVDAARAGILEDLNEFRSTPPSAADVARAVNVVRGASLMRRMTRISLAYEAALEVLRGREPGDERRAIEALSHVTPADVARVTQLYLDPARFSEAVVR